MNPITLVDGYKLGHRQMWPQGLTRVYSNWTPRASRNPDIDSVVFFGAQYFLQEYLMNRFKAFFDAPVDEVCEKYTKRVNGYLGPNSIGVDHIRALHTLGYLPLEFCALPEGTSVPLKVPMLTVENTHPDFGWLPNYIETLMSSVLWLPCTSATNAREFRKLMDRAAVNTGTAPEFVDWQGHDFSFRGMAGPEAAALSGAAHLLFFTGTDTIPALDLIEENYGVPENYLLGGSVAATEHSVMCAGGEDDEQKTFQRLLDLYPSGVLSVVSDTWDLWNVLTTILPALKDQIMARDGKLVIRPDSGDPADILCGIPGHSGPEGKGVVEILWDLFGGTVTSTGHRLLDSHIGCIYGDSITNERARDILARLAAKNFASGNVVFGVGSFTYQYVTRDTFGFAMKATWAEVDGVARDVYKAPKTDSGMKRSARGRLAVLKGDGDDLLLVEQANPAQEAASFLRPVWRNGQFLVRDTFDVVRARARKEA